jgi:hypothetical protein
MPLSFDHASRRKARRLGSRVERLSALILGDGTGSLGDGRLFLGEDILTIQAEPPVIDPFDISFFAATVAERNFRTPHLCSPTLERKITSCDQTRQGR